MDAGRVYVPDAQLISSKAAQRQAVRAIDAQTRGVDPTIFTTPAHYLPASQTGVGRENDLALAQACADVFAARQLSEPLSSDAHGHRRRLFATLMVDAGQLNRSEVDWLIESYAELTGVDGYLLWAVRFNKGLGQAQLLHRFAQGLQSRTVRPVVAGGLWHFHVSALARGLAATCVGPGRLEYPKMPPPETEDAGDATDGDRHGRALHTYHGAILGCFGLRTIDEARRRRAFMRFPCPCGAHPASSPPKTRAELVAHNRFWLLQESRDAISGTTGEATARLTARLPVAREARALLRMGPLKACWSTLAAADQQATG
jgi:hypothetical protein